jgi:hypothetical protein
MFDAMPPRKKPATVPALTILQPWAWAISHGPKRIENRTWKPRYRGPLLIHAGRGKTALDYATRWLESQGLTVPEDLAYGQIVAVCQLAAVVPLEACKVDPFASGPECWQLSDVRALAEPIKYRGRQGLFPVPLTALSDEVRAWHQEAVGQSRPMLKP